MDWWCFWPRKRWSLNPNMWDPLSWPRLWQSWLLEFALPAWSNIGRNHRKWWGPDLAPRWPKPYGWPNACSWRAACTRISMSMSRLILPLPLTPWSILLYGMTWFGTIILAMGPVPAFWTSFSRTRYFISRPLAKHGLKPWAEDVCREAVTLLFFSAGLSPTPPGACGICGLLQVKSLRFSQVTMVSGHCGLLMMESFASVTCNSCNGFSPAYNNLWHTWAYKSTCPNPSFLAGLCLPCCPHVLMAFK